MLKRFWNWLLSDVTETSTVSTSEPKQGTSLEQGSADSSWWQRTNAIYFRDNCSQDFLIRRVPVSSFDYVFADGLTRYISTFGNWQLVRDYPDIQVAFLAVDAFGLRENWNRRDVNLKQAILTDLKKSYAAYAANRGLDYANWLNILIVDIWWYKDSTRDVDMLVLEVPYTTFSVQYSHLAAVLAPEEYWAFRRNLGQSSKI